MGKENLIPQAHKLTVGEQSEGGKASGRSRRQKKSMREAAEAMMTLKAPDQLLQQMRAQGIPKSDDRYVHAVVFAQMARALKGDTKAASLIMELLGERIEKIEVTKVDDESLREMERFLDEQNADL